MSIDFQRLILDHVTIPERARPVVGWRVRHDPCYPMIRRFETTTDGGETWTIQEERTGVLPSGWAYTIAVQVLSVEPAGTRLVEYRETEPESDEWAPVQEEE